MCSSDLARFAGKFGIKLIKKGRLDQNFETIPGKTYRVSGQVRIDREMTAPVWGGLRVQVVDDSTTPWTQLATSSYYSKTNSAEGKWTLVDFSFMANRDQARLVHQNFGPGDFEVSVDDFRVSLVPGP